MMHFDHATLAQSVARAIEICGLAVLVIGGVVSLYRFARSLLTNGDAYAGLRRDLGRSILLGLEFLVAGDIISTITIEPTINSVAVLGLIVLIRTFLSFSLEVEINGRWPWQSRGQSHD